MEQILGSLALLPFVVFAVTNFVKFCCICALIMNDGEVYPRARFGILKIEPADLAQQYIQLLVCYCVFILIFCLGRILPRLVLSFFMDVDERDQNAGGDRVWPLPGEHFF